MAPWPCLPERHYQARTSTKSQTIFPGLAASLAAKYLTVAYRELDPLMPRWPSNVET